MAKFSDEAPWAARILAEAAAKLLVRRGVPVDQIPELAKEIVDEVAQNLVDREVERALYGTAMDELIGIMGQYKGDGDEP